MDKTYFDTMKAEIKLFRERMKEEGEKFFLEQSRELFKENPTLLKFAWHQYTPYFNDGDPCVFRASLAYPNILLSTENGVVLDEEGKELPEYDEDVWMDEESYFKDEDNSVPAQTHRNVVAFLEQFDDEDVENFFGDHCQVVVSREGIEVEEYSHD